VYFTDRGIGEPAELHPDFDVPVGRLAAWLACADYEDDSMSSTSAGYPRNYFIPLSVLEIKRSGALPARLKTCLAECGQVASMDESDGQMLAATARGDADAFGRFYRRHEQQILSYAIAHCANASDVADVVGETLSAACGAAIQRRRR
jgi:hypothetical protein